METLECSRVCRLCGKPAVITIDVFSKRENYVKKMNLILPILVHEMDFLPKCICYPCNYKLQEFHQFYQTCLKIDSNFKNQLSWMQSSKIRRDIKCPMVEINHVKIKEEPLECKTEEFVEPICNNENLTNFSENNNRQFYDRNIKFSARTCCCCDAKKSMLDAKIRNCVTSKSKNYRSVKQKVTDYVSRDTIRRNLFATEVFGDKHLRIQTEIPVCNFSGQMSDETTKEANLTRGTKRLGCRQNGGVTTAKIENLVDTKEIIPRELRSRKKDGRTIDSSTSIAAVPTKPRLPIRPYGGTNNTKTVRPIRPEIKIGPLVKIKQEPSDEMERSLRPRRAFINYSETSIKIIVPRMDGGRRRVKKRKIPKYNRDTRESIRKTLKTDNFSGSSVKKDNNDNGTMLIRRPLISLVKLEREDLEMYWKNRSWNFQQPNKRSGNEITDEFDRKKSKIDFHKFSLRSRTNNDLAINAKNLS